MKTYEFQQYFGWAKAAQIRQSGIWRRKVSAKAIREVWDYRAAGLKVKDAIKIIDRIPEPSNGMTPTERKWNRRAKIREHRERYRYDGLREIVELFKFRKREFEKIVMQAVPVDRLKPVGNYREFSICGSYVITAWNDAEWVDSGYRSHPNWGYWKTNRRVITVEERMTGYIMRTVAIREIPGAWSVQRIRDAVFSALKIRHLHSVKKNLALDQRYRLRHIRTMGSVRVFARSVKGTIQDYVAVRGSVTYHDVTAKKAVNGLASKIRKADAIAAAVYTRDSIHAIHGFCRAGISEFCEICGIPEDQKTMTLKEIRAAVRENRVYLDHLKPELQEVHAW